MCSTIHKTYTFSHNNLLSFGNNNITLSSFSKAEINNDPEKFAAAAKEWSGCPSAAKGGDLGEFGPGMMVKNFDEVCFNEEVGVVQGPVSTQFGEHLILITSRTGEE